MTYVTNLILIIAAFLIAWIVLAAVSALLPVILIVALTYFFYKKLKGEEIKL